MISGQYIQKRGIAMNDQLTETFFADCDPWKWCDDPNDDPEFRNKCSALFEGLDDCATVAYEIAEMKRNKNTVEIKALIDRAMVLIEGEM